MRVSYVLFVLLMALMPVQAAGGDKDGPEPLKRARTLTVQAAPQDHLRTPSPRRQSQNASKSPVGPGTRRIAPQPHSPAAPNSRRATLGVPLRSSPSGSNADPHPGMASPHRKASQGGTHVAFGNGAERPKSPQIRSGSPPKRSRGLSDASSGSDSGEKPKSPAAAPFQRVEKSLANSMRLKAEAANRESEEFNQAKRQKKEALEKQKLLISSLKAQQQAALEARDDSRAAELGTKISEAQTTKAGLKEELDRLENPWKYKEVDKKKAAEAPAKAPVPANAPHQRQGQPLSGPLPGALAENPLSSQPAQPAVQLQAAGGAKGNARKNNAPPPVQIVIEPKPAQGKAVAASTGREPPPANASGQVQSGAPVVNQVATAPQGKSGGSQGKTGGAKPKPGAANSGCVIL